MKMIVNRANLSVEIFVEILELLFFQLQIYMEGLCHYASGYALPFPSVVEPEYKDEKSHVIFDDEVISLDYFDNSKRIKTSTKIQKSRMDNKKCQTFFDVATFSRNVYMDDKYFGIIE